MHNRAKAGQEPARCGRLACAVSDGYVHIAEDGDEGRIDCCRSLAWSDEDGVPVGRMAYSQKMKKGDGQQKPR